MAFREIVWNRRTFLGTLGALAVSIFNSRKRSAFPPAADGKATPVTDFGASGSVYENWAKRLPDHENPAFQIRSS